MLSPLLFSIPQRFSFMLFEIGLDLAPLLRLRGELQIPTELSRRLFMIPTRLMKITQIPVGNPVAWVEFDLPSEIGQSGFELTLFPFQKPTIVVDIEIRRIDLDHPIVVRYRPLQIPFSRSEKASSEIG